MSDSIIVGREREVSQLAAALDEAIEGRGAVWYLTGEPGIGKSRLAEEVGQLARERDMGAFWGRCWEAGGAPAYWPWIQVLRGLLRAAESDPDEAHRETLAQILPELSSRATAQGSDLTPDQARFRLMDAIGSTIAEVAQRLPLLIVLEDLHAADVSSVLLLEFLAAPIRHQRLLILGTFRDVDLAAAPAGTQLMHATRQGRRLSLERFGKADVASFLELAGARGGPRLVDTLHEATDGHPLFLVEVARLWGARGSGAVLDPLTIPRTVRTAIRERLNRVTPRCLKALERGAIVGREFDVGLLEACHDEEPIDYVAGCQEATEAAILVETAPQRYRFVHFLIRQVVYEALDEEERNAVHARLAELLAQRRSDRGPRWSEVAHHLAAANRCWEASAAYRRAGTQALEQLAFEEAIQAHQGAIAAAEKSGQLDRRLRGELLLELAHAQTRAGDIASGKRASADAAVLARQLDDAELLARAALAHGDVLIHAKVDPELVHLLEEALERLRDRDSVLRARVMARLAAAQQPCPDPQGPMEMAREAIAMARRLEDPETLLDTLRNGGSAFVDLGDLEERLALDREHATLAEALGNRVEALRGNLRSIMDYLELGRLDDAFRAMHACRRITEELDHPFYRWRATAMDALRATWEGDFEAAEQLVEGARELGRAGGDPNAEVVYAAQKVRLLQLRGEYDAQIPLLDELDRHWGDSELGRTTARIIVGAEHVLAGRTARALRGFDAVAAQSVLRLGDHTLHLSLSRLAIAANDRELGEQLYRALSMNRDRLVTGGMLHMTLEGPARWGLGALASFLERDDEAREHYDEAIEMAQRTNGLPTGVSISLEYAAFLAESPDEGSRKRALQLAREAVATARDLGMRGAVADGERILASLQSAKEPGGSVSAEIQELVMRPIGDAWLVRYGNVEFHLKDVRGVRLLAALIAAPGREIHVLDLSGENQAPPKASQHLGDAGETLDQEARRQYEARVKDLGSQIEEAEAWNDTERAQRAREELAFIESELARAFGIGGRPRKAKSASERARVNVQRRIRDAIRRIEEHHPALAKHLSRTVRTGTYCSYDP